MYYYTGCGVAQDDAEAVGWERRAAEQGNAQAQHNRGVSYRDGLGVVQDYGKLSGGFGVRPTRER